jgi:putative spermidine/putrescine transport system substrate-binding protein
MRALGLLRRGRLVGAGALLAALVVVGVGIGLAVGQSNELTVILPGGTLARAYRKNVVEPLEKKHNARVNVVTGLTMENLAKLRAQKGNPQIDVVIFDPPGAIPAAKEGLLEPLDPEKIPNMKNLYPWGIQKDRFYVTWLTANQVLAYNTKFVKEPPKSWADLWKPEYKGKVVLPDISTSHGVYFLSIVSKMQTGSDLYNTDAAFEKVKSLRGNVLTFYTSHDQVAQLLNSGEAWLVPWTSDRALTQVAAKAPIAAVVPREGAIYWTSEMGIPRGARGKALAEKYIDLAMSPEVQAMNAQEVFIGPSNRTVKLEGDLANNLPYGERLKQLIAPDWDKLDQLRDTWTDRWNREVR